MIFSRRTCLSLLFSVLLAAIIAIPAHAGGGSWFNSNDYMAALGAMQQQNYGQAKQLLGQLRQKHPQQPRILLDLATVHTRLGEQQHANHYKQQLQQHFPNSMEARWVNQLTAPATTTTTPAPSLPAINAIATKTAPPAASPAKDDNYHTYKYPWETSGGDAPAKQSTPVTQTARVATQQTQPAPQPTAQQTGMDPAAMQQMMLMSMMMGGNSQQQNPLGGMGANMMGGNGNNTQQMGLNPMMLMMPALMGQQQTGGNGYGPNGSNGMDPDIMSSMMMNQMMSGMDFGTSNNNR